MEAVLPFYILHQTVIVTVGYFVLGRGHSRPAGVGDDWSDLVHHHHDRLRIPGAALECDALLVRYEATSASTRRGSDAAAVRRSYPGKIDAAIAACRLRFWQAVPFDCGHALPGVATGLVQTFDQLGLAVAGRMACPRRPAADFLALSAGSDKWCRGPGGGCAAMRVT